MFYFGVGFLRMPNGTTHDGHSKEQQKPGDVSTHLTATKPGTPTPPPPTMM